MSRQRDLPVILLGGALAIACAVSAPRWRSYPGITAILLALIVLGALWQYWHQTRWRRFAASMAGRDQSSIRFEGRTYAQAGRAADVALALGWQPHWPEEVGARPVVLTLTPGEAASPALDVLGALHRTGLIGISPL